MVSLTNNVNTFKCKKDLYYFTFIWSVELANIVSLISANMKETFVVVI